MLVLSRKVGEIILVGDDIEVMVVRIVGDMVKLGIEAPRGIPVDRKEVREAAILRERQRSSLLGPLKEGGGEA